MFPQKSSLISVSQGNGFGHARDDEDVCKAKTLRNCRSGFSLSLVKMIKNDKVELMIN